MQTKFLIRALDSHSDNRKPVLSEVEGSKTCAESFDRAQDRLRRTIQNPKWMGLSVIAFVRVVAGAAAEAQQPTKAPRVGSLSTGSPSSAPARIEAFRQGLRELGYMWREKTLSLSGDLPTENPIASPRLRLS